MATMQRQFGTVRNTNNRLDTIGYFMATGDTQAIANVRSNIETKSQEVVSANSVYESAKAELDRLNLSLQNARNWQYGGLCKPVDTKNKCNGKRSAYEQNTILPLLSNIDLQEAKLNNAKTDLDIKRAELDSLQRELESLLEAQELQAQSTLTLAQQGKTPEQIKIEAQAKADAETKKALVDAEKKERRSKSIRIIILSTILLGLLLGGYWLFKKIKKG